MRDLHLVGAVGNGRRRPRVDAVLVAVLHERGEAFGLPVAGASDLGLEAAGQRHRGAFGGGRDDLGGRVPVERDRSAGVGVRDVVATGYAVRAVVDVPAAVERDLVLVVARGHVEGARVDAVGAQRELRGLAAGSPVARAAHRGVVDAGHRDEVDRLLGLLLFDEVHGVADRGVGAGGRAVARGIRRHRAVLDERAVREAGGVVEDAGARVFGGAERLPFVVAGDAPREARLLPGGVVDVGGDRRHTGDPGARGGRRDRDGGCRVGGAHRAVGLQHHGAERRHGDGCHAVGVRRHGRAVGSAER